MRIVLQIVILFGKDLKELFGTMNFFFTTCHSFCNAKVNGDEFLYFYLKFGKIPTIS